MGLKITPTVLDPDVRESVTIEAIVVAGITRVEFSLQNQRVTLPMVAGERVQVPALFGAKSAVVWRATVPSDSLLLRAEINHHTAFVGGISVGSDAIEPLSVWLDDGAPTVGVSALAVDAQASAHIVNIRTDEIDAAFMGNPSLGSVPALGALASVVRRFYQLYPDEYDFLAVIGTVVLPSSAAGFHLGVRNRTLGIGQAPFDVTDRIDLGASQRLESVIAYARFTFADLAASTFSHEVAHRWMVRLTGPGFESSGSHWPISDMAGDMMGFQGPATSGRMPYRIDSLAPGRFQFNARPVSQAFSTMELYLMGLVPAAEVTQAYRLFRFADVAQVPIPRAGLQFDAAMQPFTIDSLIARVGPRLPGASDSRKVFRVGTIVMSYGRLLTLREMNLFELLAARGEMRGPLELLMDSGRDGASHVLPFFDATGGRAQLVTRLHPAF